MKIKSIKFLAVLISTFGLISCGGTVSNSTDVQNSSNYSDNSSGSNGSSYNSSSQDDVQFMDYFLQARDSTINGSGWSYKDNLNITTKMAGIAGPTAKRPGETYYSKTGDIGFYQHFTSSGALLVDGQSHAVRKGTNLQTIKQDEDGNVSSIKNETVDSNYKYDTSTYAKAIFTYTQDDIKSITKDPTVSNRYIIRTKANASSVLTSLVGNIDNSTLKSIITAFKAIDSASSEFIMYVTFTNDNKIDTYSYSFSADVTVLGQKANLSISYSLDFSNYQAQTIAGPSFDGLSINDTDINKDLTKVKNVLGTYRGLERSAYDYEVRTDITGLNDDFAITVKGDTKRVFVSGINYFDNIVKMDQAKYLDSTGDEYADYNGARGLTSDGKVYDVHSKVLSKNTEEVTSTNLSLDYFYFLPQDSFFVLSNTSFIQSKTKDNVTTYNILLNNNGIDNMLKFISDSIRLQPLNSENVSIFGTYQTSTFTELDSVLVSVTSNASGFSSLEVNLQGNYQTTIQKQTGNARFKTTIELTVTDGAKDYSAPSEAKKLY